MKRLSIFVLCMLCVVIGCGEEAAESGVVAAECVQADLVEQCPPNTAPVLEADSAAVCQQDTSIDVDGVTGSGDGSVSNVCVGTASCKVVCELMDPCLNGIVSISPTEGVECFIPDGGCGDGDCGVGEDPVLCPQDCAAECEPNIARCTNGQLERCASNGLLEDPVPCADGERCVDPDGEMGASCVVNFCGDGVSTGDEECDDGNDVNADACTNACTLPICGDGIVNANEECDEGNFNSDTAADTCRANCKLPSCGDGVRDPGLGEACDDGNIDNGDACTSGCILATCGDGIVDREEECDDGERNSDTQANACRTNCTRARCGDDVQDAGEECDRGGDNGVACSYGEMSCEVCSDACRRVMGDTSFCGDSREDAMAGEQCDDGNQVTEVCPYSQMSCVVCNATCQETAGAVSYCGDGTEDGPRRTGGEAEGCDDGADNGDNRACKSDCTEAFCGDGLRLLDIEDVSDERFEYCDDGNEVDINDGCNRNCEPTERRENLEPPSCGTSQMEGDSCRLDPRLPFIEGGNCLLSSCRYTNPLPLIGRDGENAEGRINGVLTYNSSLSFQNRRDIDVFGFEQLCGYGSLGEARGSDCVDENSAVYYFTVDYRGGGTNMPFTVQQDCNGSVVSENGDCPVNIAKFCTPDDPRTICSNVPDDPPNMNRAYWCARANVVGDYRVWLSLRTDASISYSISVREVIGQSDCFFPIMLNPLQ